ncbi:protein Pet54p [Monosporozyma unispora]|nr:hypothetical protein C6P44_005203 [Kazachstania unispora]
MSSNVLLEKLIQNVVTESNKLGTRLSPLNKAVTNYQGQLLTFQSYNPGFTLTRDLIDNTITAPSPKELLKDVCLVPFRDHKYLTFKDKYYLLFRNSNAMQSFLSLTPTQDGIPMTNNDIRLKLKLAYQTDAFKNYFTRFYNTLQDYSQSNNEHITINDIRHHRKIIFLQNNVLQPIMDKSLLLWNFHSKEHNIKDMFWYYNIKNSIELFNDPNNINNNNDNAGPTTLHYLLFQCARDRNSFQSNIHGSILQNNKLLVEPL